ncbi:MAG: hypothetical protein K2G97_00025, partial [Oscillospiraceae bacterium]|nr:hypothetical protein [Oscillospiraceae bacterium]
MKIKSILSIILTVSIVVISFPLVVQAKEQTEEETVISVTQVIKNIENEMQAAPKPAEITEHFDIDSNQMVDEIEDIKEIENKMQITPKPTEITDNFDIDSKDKFIEFMTTSEYHKSNWGINLQCDIDMGGLALSPIGHYFGTFNGNGHVVRNISLTCFAIDNQGTISGIRFQNCQQVNVAYDGITAGFVIQNNRNGIINNCFIENDIINANENKDKKPHCVYVAGFVSANYGQITGCSATGNITGNGNYVGGFAGYNSGTINSCTATGNVTGNSQVGGFVGVNENGTIIDCTAEGEVIGDNDVAGFVVYNVNDGMITNCKATKNVTGKVQVGGFVGKNTNEGTMTRCTAAQSRILCKRRNAVKIGKINLGGSG